MVDNNHFAAALNMAIPLLVAIALTTKSKLLRIVAVTLVPFCVLAILFTFSRGGLLTLGVVTGLLVLRTKKRALAIPIVMVAVLVYLFLPSEGFRQSYVDRATGIADFHEDSSAMGRIEAWKISWQVFRDNPVHGVGPENFLAVYRRYGDPDQAKVAHSSYFQFLAECGLPAAVLFVGIILVSLIRLESVASSRASPDEWTVIHARALQTSIAAYAVGSLFLNMAYFDLFYHLVALSVCLEYITVHDATEDEPVERKEEGPWWRQAPLESPPSVGV